MSFEMSTAPAPPPDNAVRWAHHPAEQLAHLAAHTPIQVPRGAADGHHPAAMLQPGSFQLQQGTPFTGLEQTAQYQRSFPHNFSVQNGGAFAQLSAAQLQQHNQAVAQQPNYELFAQRIAAEQQQQLQRLQQQPQIVDATWFDAQKTQSAWSEVQTSPQRPQLQRPQSAQQPQPPHSQMQLLSPQPAYHHALLSPTHGNPLWQQHAQSQRSQLHLTPPQSSPSSTVTTTPQNGLLSTVSVKRSPSVGEQERRRSPMAPQGARSCFTSPQPTMADNATVKREEHRTAEETTDAAASNENHQDSGTQQFEKLRTILDFEHDNQDRNEDGADRESVEKERSLEASRLLLNLSGSENSEPSGEENSNEEITVDCSDATAKDECISQPQHAQETSVDAVIRNVLTLTSIASPTGGAAAGATSTTTASENGAASSNGTSQKHRSYFRPPGLGAPTDASSDSNVLVCNVCGFSCTSKFHYNSHMNTHSDHKCSICNYTSRTEGRLKKHIMDSHTQEDRIAAGLDVPTNTGSNGCSDAKDIDKLQQELSSTMSSLLESANRIVATEANGETATSMTPTSVTVNVAVMNGDSIPQSSDSAFSVSNPLENIRALAEKNGLLNGAALDPSNLSSTLSGLLGGSDTNG
ncbi:CRE-HBL-1 protein, partial [Aphelenchoides avenae]